MGWGKLEDFRVWHGDSRRKWEISPTWAFYVDSFYVDDFPIIYPARYSFRGFVCWPIFSCHNSRAPMFLSQSVDDNSKPTFCPVWIWSFKPFTLLYSPAIGSCQQFRSHCLFYFIGKKHGPGHLQFLGRKLCLFWESVIPFPIEILRQESRSNDSLIDPPDDQTRDGFFRTIGGFVN